MTIVGARLRVAAALFLLAGCGRAASGGESAENVVRQERLLDALDDDVAITMERARVPGLAIAVVRGGREVESRGHGLADIASGREVTADTLFLLASISKSVTAVALMQAYEQGAFELDDAIDDRLPFTVRNPSFPDVPITYRMLLTHTSSITDSDEVDAHTTLGADSPIPLSEFLEEYLTPGGAYYTKASWDRHHAPGARYAYSNMGASLAGALVEQIAGESLEGVCQRQIFAPLGMHESSWFLAGLDPSHVATPYETDEEGRSVVAGPYGFPDYPDVQLRTSAAQLARFMMALLGGGSLGGATILSKETVDEMMRSQIPWLGESQGLIFYYDDIGRYRVIGHNGVFLGATTEMFFDPASGGGFILLSNGGLYDHHDTSDRLDAMMSLEEKLMDIAARP